MSAYVSRQNDIPSPTITDTGQNEDDFLQDPDQRWDDLPQPFRFLNKILRNIVEEAFEIAHYREGERISEATRIRPPKYTCASQIKVEPEGYVAI